MRNPLMILACLMLATPAWAQDADPNLRHPTILAIDGEDGVQSQFVIGDGAWGDMLGTLGGLRNADPAQSAGVAEQLWAQRDRNAPLFLFEVARLTAETNPERALEAYFLGRARAIYDVSRCVDSSAFAVVDVASGEAGEAVSELLRSDAAGIEAALTTVIESGSAFTGQASPWWACSFGNAAYLAAVNEAEMPGAEWLKVESLWPGLRETITASMNANLAMIREAATAP